MQTDVQRIKQQILPHYFTSATLATYQASVTPLGNGHINTTWLVQCGAQQMVLQQLNTQVFTAPWRLVQNSVAIADFLQQADNYAFALTQPIYTLAEEAALDDNELGFWRAISFVADSHSIEQMDNTAQAEQTAYAFGQFVAALEPLDANKLHDTIPQFRHLPARLAALSQLVAADRQQRVSGCQPWIDFALSQQRLLDDIQQMEARLPLRICHNDTKINNLLFNSADEPVAVVDLDTCMPGYLMYDFGDMVRSCCAAVAEDATELDKVNVLPDYFAAICHGWLRALDTVMTADERASLWLGVKVVTFMLAVRFLNDYLDGDRYFRIHHAGHNLERAINQFTLYQRFVAQEAQLLPLLNPPR